MADASAKYGLPTLRTTEQTGQERLNASCLDKISAWYLHTPGYQTLTTSQWQTKWIWIQTQWYVVERLLTFHESANHSESEQSYKLQQVHVDFSQVVSFNSVVLPLQRFPGLQNAACLGMWSTTKNRRSRIPACFWGEQLSPEFNNNYYPVFWCICDSSVSVSFRPYSRSIWTVPALCSLSCCLWATRWVLG